MAKASKLLTSIGVGGVLTIIEHLIGKWDCSLQFLVIAIILDYITGIAVGWATKTLESDKATKGLIKKFFILVYIILGHQLDVMLNVDYVRSGVCYMYAVGEVLSIMENGGKLGLPIPTPIKKALKVMNEAFDGENENKTDKIDGDND